MSMLSRNGSLSAVDRVMGAARRNPEGVLLLAAGCALLMRGIGAATHALRDREDATPQRKTSGNGRRRGAEMEEDVSGVVDTAREYASDLAGRVVHSAEAAVHYAGDARRAAVQQTSRVAQQTRSGAGDAMERMLNEQPLTLALFGLAAGALLAGALPGTRMERRAFAPVGERLGETAEEARRRLKRSVSKARARMGEVAEEHGLTADGLRQAAGDVADAFGDELMGDHETAAGPAKRRRAAGGPKGRSRAKAAPTRKAGPSAKTDSAREAQQKVANGAASSDEPGRSEAARPAGERSA